MTVNWVVELLVGQNRTVTTRQRLAIAKTLVNQSIDALIPATDDDRTLQVAQDLSVALYELEQLTQELNTLLNR